MPSPDASALRWPVVLCLCATSLAWGCSANLGGEPPSGFKGSSGAPPQGKAVAYLEAGDECGDGLDNNGDGRADEDCPCRSGDRQRCFLGSGTPGAGACTWGEQVCPRGEFSVWGVCTGSGEASEESCDAGDEDCDGEVDETCECALGATRECYEGPAGTEGRGVCEKGQQTCVANDDGTRGWGPCAGQTLPGEETCDDLDNDCDDETDPDCNCTLDDQRPCYEGPEETLNQGLCRPGVERCISVGKGTDWSGECENQVLPAKERCDNLDNDCDGEPDNGCRCSPGDTRDCYDKPGGTPGVGICREGKQRCVVDRAGRARWGACKGAVGPQRKESCDDVDNTCDEIIDEGCICDLGDVKPCYPGPKRERGVGQCKVGERRCVLRDRKPSWSRCKGAVGPSKDICDGIDNDCDGDRDEDCVCEPGERERCYTGPAETRGVGTCEDGERVCERTEDGMTRWGLCGGQVLPQATETCHDGRDDNCDGEADNGCPCRIGDKRSCYTGPPDTRGNEPCRDGTSTCVQSYHPYLGWRIGWSRCWGQRLPESMSSNILEERCFGEYVSPPPNCI